MASTGTAIEVTAKFFPLAFILYLTRPTVWIDGTAHPSSWGTNRFDVTAGKHTVKVAFRYLFLKEAGANSIDVDVPEGTTVKVRYRAPLIVFIKGSLKTG